MENQDQCGGGEYSMQMHKVSNRSENFCNNLQNRQQIQIYKQTPLEFVLQINNTFYISYDKKQLNITIIKTLIWVLISSFIAYVLHSVEDDYIPKVVKNLYTVLIYLQIILYLIVFFLDPGTLFEDQKETFYQDRLYCKVCQVYRTVKTKHCTICNKCIMGSDHHCSVFSKCIGRRNIAFFWIFLIIFSFNSLGLILLIGTVALNKIIN